jgi:hypothetical protein
MPSCVEVALLRLKKPWTTEDLEKDPTHAWALSVVTAQPGNLGCTWGVLTEDPTILVWLVGEYLRFILQPLAPDLAIGDKLYIRYCGAGSYRLRMRTML